MAGHTVRLLGCPFCGGEAEIVHINEGENAGGSCVSCTQCTASSNVEFEFKENFVSNWNRRVSVNSQEALVAALEWIEQHNTVPYIQIGDDPNECGPTVMVPNETAKRARQALDEAAALSQARS